MEIHNGKDLVVSIYGSEIFIRSKQLNTEISIFYKEIDEVIEALESVKHRVEQAKNMEN